MAPQHSTRSVIPLPVMAEGDRSSPHRFTDDDDSDDGSNPNPNSWNMLGYMPDAPTPEQIEAQKRVDAMMAEENRKFREEKAARAFPEPMESRKRAAPSTEVRTLYDIVHNPEGSDAKKAKVEYFNNAIVEDDPEELSTSGIATKDIRAQKQLARKMAAKEVAKGRAANVKDMEKGLATMINDRAAAKTKVLLQSGLADEDRETAKKTLQALQGEVIDDIESAAFMVAAKLSLTATVLCAIGRRIPIVTMEWIRASADKNFLLKNAKNYVLENDKFIIKAGRTMKQLLYDEREDGPLLEGWTVASVGEHKMSQKDIGQIVRSCKGEFVDSVDELRDPEKSMLILAGGDLKSEAQVKLAEARKRKIRRIEFAKFVGAVIKQSKSTLNSNLKT